VEQPNIPWQIIIPTAAALLVAMSARHSAYLARQQQIRIEKHRVDPTFPLEPPPSRIKVFFRRHGAAAVAVVANVNLLIYQLTRSEPITRWTILIIGFVLCSTLYILVSEELSAHRRALLWFIENEIERGERELKVVTDELVNLTEEVEKGRTK
jgi:hypothetical protein